MVDILTPKKRSALNRALKHPELLPRLFKKVKELYWFDVFSDAGLLDSSCNPPPKPTNEEGYFQIPVWPITEYLVSSSAVLKDPVNNEYAIKYRNFLRLATKYSEEEGYGNYRTWWQFAKIIKNIPVELLDESDIKLVQYWMSDKFEHGLVSDIIGSWILDLLENNDDHSKSLLLLLLDVIYNIKFVDKNIGSSERMEAILLFDSYKIDELTTKISKKSGYFLKNESVEIFKTKLEIILEEQGNDEWSSIWRPAIEDHTQNVSRDDADDVVLKGFRDSLLGFIDSSSVEADVCLNDLFDSQYQTIKRIAIYIAGEEFNRLNSETSGRVLDKKFFDSNYKHETWHYLAKNYDAFSSHQKKLVYTIIDDIVVLDNDEDLDLDKDLSNKRTAYQRSIWLSAIKEKDDVASILYNQCIEISGAEPEYPDFSSYMSTDTANYKSPIELEYLRALDYRTLVNTLNEYHSSGGFREPGIEGLTKVFRELVKMEAGSLYKELDGFVELDIPYIYSLLDAFLDLWEHKTDLNIPWINIWPALLGYINTLIKREDFWQWPEKRDDGAFVANHYWIIGAVGRLIESGCKSDEHSFDVDNILISKNIIEFLLLKVTGEEFKYDSDAVSIAINSTRGRCLEAIINLSLYECRNHEKLRITHSAVWEKYKPLYDTELFKADIDEYEFATLVAKFLHNFMYLSEEWVVSNLEIIFDQKNYQRWLCAMQAYSYINRLHPIVYDYLKRSGDFVKTLDDENLKDRVDDRYIQFITLAFINNDEDLNLSDSLISILLSRKNTRELRQIIWFLWTFRDNIDEDFRSKVYDLWPRFLNIIDAETQEGKKLASQLCQLTVYINEIDSERKKWLMAVAPFAEVDYKSHDLIEMYARLSSKYPFEVKDIWLAMLTDYSYDYPEDAIKKAFNNLVECDRNGINAAKEIAGAYLKHGVDRPTEWLKKIIK